MAQPSGDMSVESLLVDLHRRGIELRVTRGELEYRTRATIPPAVEAAIDATQPALLRHLAAAPWAGFLGGTATPHPARTPGGRPWGRVLVCAACRGRRFWRGADGQPRCATCRPPDDARQVTAWL